LLERYTPTDFKINTEIASDLNITQIWTRYWTTKETGYKA
jgi:hypothetical protein